MNSEKLPALLDRAARLVGQRLIVGRLDPQALGSTSGSPREMLCEAWRKGGLSGELRVVTAPTPADLPLVGWLQDLGWFLLQGRDAAGNWQGIDADGTDLTLAKLEGAECMSLPRRRGRAPAAPRAFRLVREAVLARKVVFLEAILATGLVNLLTLAVSIYSMQVYDRVIPNQGFQTLWVLSVGVVVSILMELLLKQVRSRTVDRSCTGIDVQLSDWLFQRLLGVRMDQRPGGVGGLASQVKGFELVRGVLTSTSLFVLADVPFAIFFVFVIAMVGGVVVIVPLIALPLALLTGLMFQRAIRRHSRMNLAGSNRKSGLLVEAVDGAETLKASGGEWRLQSRWNELVREVSQSEERTRGFTSLSQNLTAAFQQLGYISLVAAGAYLVTENQLTMGGLLACSIISNRAMAPIVQLPGVMAQWAHARAAIDGLDQIIALPNELDDERHALVPQRLSGGYRFERMRFAYGDAGQVALELDQLEIRAGERIGLLGSIGSGKSTLLKIASGLYRPSDGKVYLDGMDLALLSPPVVRETVGYLPQDYRLFSGTLRENLLLGLADPGDEAILEATRKTGLYELIGSQPKGLELMISEGGRGVSGGQRQLIGLTRLLLANPRVWLLDEPTGSMDSASEVRVVGLLREVAAGGATLVVATHKTALLPLLDRLLVLRGGRLFLDGPRDPVLAKLAGKPQVAAVSEANG